MQAGLYTVRGSLQAQLPTATVLGVLTDYASLSRIYSTIERSRLAHSRAGTQIIQVCCDTLFTMPLLLS
jgi:hypothetical protein